MPPESQADKIARLELVVARMEAAKRGHPPSGAAEAATKNWPMLTMAGLALATFILSQAGVIGAASADRASNETATSFEVSGLKSDISSLRTDMKEDFTGLKSDMADIIQAESLARTREVSALKEQVVGVATKVEVAGRDRYPRTEAQEDKAEILARMQDFKADLTARMQEDKAEILARVVPVETQTRQNTTKVGVIERDVEAMGLRQNTPN